MLSVVSDSRARKDHRPENSGYLWGTVSIRGRPGRLPLLLYCSGVFAIKILHSPRIIENIFLER